MSRIRTAIAAAGQAIAALGRSRRPQTVIGARGMTLCHHSSAGLHAAELPNDGTARPIDCAAPNAGRGRRRPIVAMLPKSQYLVKSVEVPQVALEEVPALVRLEAEASLPAEFGQAEVSYLQLPAADARPGRLRFEVYVARAEALGELVNALGRAGLRADAILPTAVAWRGILAFDSGARMLVVELPDGEMETAVSQNGNGCHVRTIERHGGQRRSQLPDGVVESIRSLLIDTAAVEPRRVLWCGAGRPAQDLESVCFEDASDDQAGGDGAAMLALAGRGIAHLPPDLLRTASLAPRGQEDRRRSREARRRLAIGGASLVMGLLCIQASLWILSARCRAATADLDQRIARIRREGETTENRLKQLRAVAATAVRQDEFQQLLTVLYESTPAGISYSEIAMDEDGKVRLHGQALSMGQPFLLPSALEGKGPLAHVVVKAAGLSKTGGGTITEFKAELTLKRGGRRP